MNAYELVSLNPREYQSSIAEKSSEGNTLVVLPTGMGKTIVAVMVGIERLKKYDGSKILITAPTRPLNAQHTKSFEKFTNIPKDEIVLVTGKHPPKKRMEMYKDATVVVATPQCIRNDLRKGIMNMADFCFIVFDEAHRAVKDYAYTEIAKMYMIQSDSPLILGLTASPGGTRAKINEITENLFIKNVEIRGESDEDVKPYVKEIEKDWVYVDFPEKYKKIKSLLESCLMENIAWLREKHYIHVKTPSKTMLIGLQKRLGSRYSKGANKFGNMWAMIRTAEAIKIEHAIGLLETQGIVFLQKYFEKMKSSKKKTDSRLVKNRKIEQVMNIVNELREKGDEHPKMKKLVSMVKDIVEPDTKVIIFANYRATVERIRNLLEEEGISSNEFIGQTTKDGKGMRQDEQIDMLDRFRENKFNVLVATSVGEEGLDVPAVDYAIFYEPVPSEIRNIQRRGRVGRQVAGKAIMMITKGTRDEAYYWSAINKEKTMKGILKNIQDKGLKRKKSLIDWAN